jgi:hypothetical protein
LKTPTIIRPSKPQYDIINSRQQVNLFLAGQGSGKTHGAGVISGILINQFPKCHGFIGANTYSQLSDSTLFRVRNVWKEFFGWKEYTKSNPSGAYVVDVNPPAHFNTENHDYDSYHGKITFKWGTVIYKGSLDNYKAHDGKEFAWALLDETKDTKEAAVKEVIVGRLREHGLWVTKDGTFSANSGNIENCTPFNPLYIFTSPAKVPWINDWFNLEEYEPEIISKIYSETDYFIKDIGNKRVVISSAYHNQANLPSNYLTNQKMNLPSYLHDMLIYGNPFSKSGGEFYKCFSRQKNVLPNNIVNGKLELYDCELPLHISFDFNTKPYMTCTVWQIKNLTKAYQIDEICLESPRNNTESTCREFARRYSDHRNGLFIYGDPAGKHEDTRTEKGVNDFTIILRELSVFRPSKRVAEKAPSVKMRGNFINTIFEKGYEGIEIFIGENCKKSIADYVYLKESSEGDKLKEKDSDELNKKITFEKYGHTSDSGDYFICFAFARQYAKYQSFTNDTFKISTGKPSAGKNHY